jgi:hypothetical protein
MYHSFARRIMTTFILLPVAAALAQQSRNHPAQDAPPRSASAQPETLAAILERCWAVEEIKSGHSSSFSSHDTNFDQRVGLFSGQVHRRWCSSSLEANGPVKHGAKRDYLTRIDSLTLRLSTDTITAELQERAGQAPRLTVNGRIANSDWWRAGSRERVLRLARVPVD